LSAYIASIGKRTPRDAVQDAAELCRLANSLSRLNEIACNSGLAEQQALCVNLASLISVYLTYASAD